MPTASLQAPADYVGLYAAWNVDGDGAVDDLWDFGTSEVSGAVAGRGQRRSVVVTGDQASTPRRPGEGKAGEGSVRGAGEEPQLAKAPPLGRWGKRRSARCTREEPRLARAPPLGRSLNGEDRARGRGMKTW